MEADGKVVPTNGPDHSTYTTTTNDLDPGLTTTMVDCNETPRMFIQRVLVDGEVVVESFDVKFPGEFLPMWKIISLLIGTLGLYSIVLLFRFVRRCCYRWRICTPDTVHFAFGKMAVTNKGRVICWKEEVYQKKQEVKTYVGHLMFCYIDGCIAWLGRCFVAVCIKPFWPELCQHPTEYAFAQETRMYRVADVKQITQFMTSEANCGFCCLEYQCGIEVSFNQFNHGANHLTVTSKTDDQEFGEEAQSAVSSVSLPSYYSWARGMYGAAKESTAFQLIRAAQSAVESAVGTTSNLNTIYIISDTNDRVHNGDVKDILKGLCGLHKRLLECLPTPPDALVEQAIDPTKFKIQGLASIQVTSTKGTTDAGKYEFTDKFTNVTIVKNDGTVSIPSEWTPLLPGEKVLAANGQVPQMNLWQWIRCGCTCGYWYVTQWRKKKFTRTALILTNKRLISVDIFERSGTVPLSLSNFSIQVRSYVLGTVKSGFIQSRMVNDLSAGIECDGGSIHIDFSGTGRKALPFAHAMQMSVARLRAKMGDAVKALKTNYAADSSNKDVDWNMFPLLSTETGLDLVHGDNVYEPFGKGKRVRAYCNAFFAASGSWDRLPVENVCSKETCGTMYFPLCPLLWCCCLRPFQIKTDFLVTDMSILRYTRKFNRGLCCQGFCTTDDSFMMSWQSIRSFQGYSVNVWGAGKESWFRRCCGGNIIGRYFCPMGTHDLTLAIDFAGNYGYELKKVSKNKSWVKDEEINATQRLLSHVSVQLQEEAKNGDWPPAGGDIEAGGGSDDRYRVPAAAVVSHEPSLPGGAAGMTYAPAGSVAVGAVNTGAVMDR